MKQIFAIMLFQCLYSTNYAQLVNPEISLIPEPVSVIKNSGKFILPRIVTIEAVGDAAVKKIADSLANQLALSTGYKISVADQANSSNTIRLSLNAPTDKNTLGNEGYHLEVTEQNVTLKANKPAGLFYAVQTFLQLLPREIYSVSPANNIQWQVPCMSITDYPRFGWRGLMFDVSRHFFTKAEVKAFIDEMVRYKYNLLHLHLTDDEGWRIEIKSLPKLTEVGAWNVRRTGTFGEFAPPAANEPRNYGGFFTQDDIREIVQYAAEKYVNILPEVDVPGHSLAAIASYPELSCTPGANKYKVRSGEKIMNWQTNGFTALIDNTLCPANEKVYAFLDKVFTELAELFPFEYIHIGGDECAKNFWEKSTAIKQLMIKEKLKSMEEVQSYFEKRIEKIVATKGKKVIGWDEILEGGLAPTAAVMSWRGIKGGIEAAKLGHEVVMSPTTFVYLDYMQGDQALEPPVYATLRLKTSYSFEPVPDGVDAKFIKGGQGNLWTEQVYTARHLQYMLWPRSLAIAESLWSPKEKKNWNSFAKKVETNFERMDIRQVKYSRAMFDPIIQVKKRDKDSLQILLTTEIDGLDIYYSFDNSNPDNFYPRYENALSVPKEAEMLKIITYRAGKPIGRQMDIPVADLRKRKG